MKNRVILVDINFYGIRCEKRVIIVSYCHGGRSGQLILYKQSEALQYNDNS